MSSSSTAPQRLHKHEEGEECSCQSQNPSVHQSLQEMEFERSIFQAAIDNNIERIEMLSKEAKFDVNAKDNYGYTALHYASRNGSLDSAKFLVKLGANVNLPTGLLGATPLHRAVTANKVEMVEYLLEAGADPHRLDGDGLSPLDRAEREQCLLVLRALKAPTRL